MSKRAIVLGGAGLIGSHLCVKLLSQGYEVMAIDKRGRRESSLLRNINHPDRFRYIKHDITIPYEIGCDELYNLTAPIEYGTRFDYIDGQRLSALGTINSLNIIIGDSTKVLYASSDDIYNYERPDTFYNTDKRFIADSKRFGESLHQAYHSHYNIDTRIARIFSTYGPNAGLRDQHVVSKMIVEALHNHDITIFGKGQQVRTFCYVEDMAYGLISLMQAHNSEGMLTADLGSATQITIGELAEMIISLTGSRSKIIYQAAKTSEPLYKIPNLEKTKKEINWEAKTPLREGLQRTISYIEKELSSIAMSQMSWVEIYG